MKAFILQILKEINMTKDELFEKNISIAYKIANTYLINHSKEYEDIKQIALLGLWKDVLTFKDIDAFSTYAYSVISNEINYYLRKNKKYIRNISIYTEIGENITIADVLKDENNEIEKFEREEENKTLRRIFNHKITQLKPTEKKYVN